MPHHRCVPMCSSDKRKEKCTELSFHQFPKDTSIWNKWIRNIRRDVGKYFNLNNHTRVCSLHFTEKDYELDKPGRIWKRLKKEAVPTVFFWGTPKPARCSLFRNNTLKTPNVKEESKKSINMDYSYISHDHELALDDENVLASECLETEQLDKSSSTSCNSLVDIDADPSPK